MHEPRPAQSTSRAAGRRRALAAACVATAGLAACGGLPLHKDPAQGAPVAVEATPSGEPSAPRLGALSARKLGPGECGLFLWTRADRQLVFFSNPETGRAAIVLDGSERALRRLSVEGGAVAGRPGAQTFATDTGDVSLRLTVQETEPVQDGYRVKSASLRVTDDAGWSGVVAAAGLAACGT